MSKLLLYHRGRETGESIIVDDHFFAPLFHVRWSIGDSRRPQSPRHISRLDGEPLTLSLNRLIYALSHNPHLIERDIFGTHLWELQKALAKIPPLVFEDGNVLNCTTANIIPRALSRKGQRSLSRDGLRDGTPPASMNAPSLSQENVTVFPQAVKMIQYGEKGIGATKLAKIPPDAKVVDGTNTSDLSKLFTHLSAPSDESTSNRNKGKDIK